MQRNANQSHRPTPTHDTELLALYAREGNEDALERLIHRHAPMVFSVCLRLLWRHEDAEDAFQAVFVLLARKAPTLVRHRSLAGWLHETAVRTCRQMRRQRARKRELAMTTEPVQTIEPWQSIGAAHRLEALHEEIDRLPSKYRDVVVFYHLEGKSRAQIANLLDCTTASVKGVLMRARKLLRQRLLHRGVTASTVLAVATAQSRQTGAGQVSGSLVRATLQHCRGEPPTADVGNGPAAVESLLAKETNMVLSRLSLIAPLSIGTMVFVAATIAGGAPPSGTTATPLVVESPQVSSDVPATPVVTQIAQVRTASDTATVTPAQPASGLRASVSTTAAPVTMSSTPIMTRELRVQDNAIVAETLNVVTTTAVQLVPSQVTVSEEGKTTVPAQQQQQKIYRSRVDAQQPTKLVPLSKGTTFESMEGKRVPHEEVKQRIGSGKLTVIVLGKQEPLRESWKSLLRSDALVLRETKVRAGAIHAHPIPVQRQVTY